MMATAGSVELGDQLEGGIGVVEVVVAELLALQLARRGDARPRLAADVERRLLMRVLAIAQELLELARDDEVLRENLAERAREPVRDRGIIGGGARIGLGGEALAQRERGGAVAARASPPSPHHSRPARSPP